MAAYAVTLHITKDGVADVAGTADDINIVTDTAPTVDFDDATAISRHVTITCRETGASVGLKLNEDSRNVDIAFDSGVEIRST